jgi:zinc D-Ala-D-Ala carboxypeptidase
MSINQPARRERRRGRFTLVAVLVAIGVLFAVVSCLSPRVTSAATPPTVAAPSPQPSYTPVGRVVPSDPPSSPQPDHPHDTAGAADGWLPDGVTVFDVSLPGLSKLDPALLSALQRAARAAGDGRTFYVTSGWRSPAYQEQLLDEAVATYGSRAEAARWVATPATSPHVKGHAVDIGHAAATTWLSKHGATYGLCQIYRNEPWHYELRPAAAAKGCPTMYADPTHDPRMTQ